MPIIITAHMAKSSARCGMPHTLLIIQAEGPVIAPYMSRAAAPPRGNRYRHGPRVQHRRAAGGIKRVKGRVRRPTWSPYHRGPCRRPPPPPRPPRPPPPPENPPPPRAPIGLASFTVNVRPP